LNTATAEVVNVNAQPEGFSYVDLNDVDPTFKPVPTDFYTLKVLKAELKTFKYKQTTDRHNAGDEGEFVKFQLAITNHPEYAGRPLFEALFPGRRELRALRLLMDATGVIQTPGSPIDEWLKSLSEIQPEFRCKVESTPDVDRKGNVRSIDPKTGKPQDVNVVKWTEIVPAV
jgi:hypothetical protein